MITLRPLAEADLTAIAAWLAEAHVARWWVPDPTVQAAIDEYRACLHGGEPTVVVVVSDDGRDIGWAQWYRWDDYPDEARAMEARAGEVGIDYAIGDPSAVGRGLGTGLVAALVAEVRRHHPGAGILVDPEAGNTASRRVPERTGFELVAIRPVATETTPSPMAIYRLAPG